MQGFELPPILATEICVVNLPSLLRRTYAGAYGLLNSLAEFLRWCCMYDLYRASLIWVWVPIFGESKFGSPFHQKINLPNCHATLVDFFWPTKFCFLGVYQILAMWTFWQPTDRPTDQPTERPTDQPTDRPTNIQSDQPQLDLSKMAESPPDPPTTCYPLPSTVPPAPLSILCCLAPDGSLDLQKYHDYSALLSARVQWQMSTGGVRLSTPTAASLAAAAAAWRQHGISGGSTINNQLKASAATATETATMIATTMTIKTKAMAAVAAAWRQRGGQHCGIAAVAAALLQRSGGSAVVRRRRPKDVVGLLLGNIKNTILWIKWRLVNN